MSADETSTEAAAHAADDETTPKVPVKKRAYRKAAASDAHDEGDEAPSRKTAGRKRAARKEDAPAGGISLFAPEGAPVPVPAPQAANGGFAETALPAADNAPPPSAEGRARPPDAPQTANGGFGETALPVADNTPPPAAVVETPPPAAPVPAIPVFKVVGEDDGNAPASEPDAFVFDPAKILAQFSPATPPPESSPTETASADIAKEVALAPPGVVEKFGKVAAPFPPLSDGQKPPPGGGVPKPDRRPFSPSSPSQGGGGSAPYSGGKPQAAGGAGKKPFPPPQPPSGSGGKKDKFRKGGASAGGKPQPGRQWGNVTLGESVDERALSLGEAFDYSVLNDPGVLEELAAAAAACDGEPFDFNAAHELPVNELVALGKELDCKWHRTPPRRAIISDLLAAAHAARRPIRVRGTLELLDSGAGLLVYLFDNYRIRELSAFVPKALIVKHGLQRGHEIDALALPAREGETAPVVARVDKVMGEAPDVVADWTPFTELTPYYPTRRIFLETDSATATWDNLSMRCVDLLCPVGLGQRGLIVAPPRTGKTILLQGMANAILKNTPQAHLIILLVDERPEEVTDFRRQVKEAEIVSSTFDETAESHVHAAEIVIERARRMVEAGRHVVILLDSITRLARAYNTMMPGTGKILSGGVESNALSKPKRFFGSARNIEGGGSLTILGTALVETGSKMDEVIFEEFKGTGNMELDLDRDLANKRIFPAISFERSGTRKEELLYHPDELLKIYSLRRAMKGVPSVEAMEQLIHRIKKTKTNVEFLVTLSR
jgi:transcription termination factor Rho